MKNILYGIMIGIILITLVSAGIENYQVRKSTAEVKKVLGLYIFTDSEPVMEYDILGEIKISSALSISDSYGSRRDALIKKAKREYPNADAILCYPETTGLSSVSADVIKFK